VHLGQPFEQKALVNIIAGSGASSTRCGITPGRTWDGMQCTVMMQGHESFSKPHHCAKDA